MLRTARLRDGVRRLRRIGGLQLMLLREGGRTWLIAARCPHMGASLRSGVCDDDMLWCPKHGYCFALATGQRLSPPPGSDGSGDLPCYEVAERDGWTGVRLEPDATGRWLPVPLRRSDPALAASVPEGTGRAGEDHR